MFFCCQSSGLENGVTVIQTETALKRTAPDTVTRGRSAGNTASSGSKAIYMYLFERGVKGRTIYNRPHRLQ